MNIFTQHTSKQGVSYIEHWLFAIKISKRLLNSVIAFSLHAFFPFIDIRKEHDLEATVQFIQEQNSWIEGMKQKKNLRTNDNDPINPSHVISA